MSKFIKLLALGAVFIPAAVLANGPERRFTHKGVTYRYTVTPDANGRKVIAGRSLSDGSAFRLVVNGDRVDGVSGGQPVSFRTPAAGTVTLAAN